MAKRGVAYIKPNEPNFIKKLKMQIGYKESDNVNTKFEHTHENFDENDKYCEEPQVVVLKPGDLTAEEARQIKQATEIKQHVKADLSQKVVFNPNFKKSMNVTELSNLPCEINDSTTKAKKQKKNKPVLSFDYQDGDSN